MNKTTIKPTKLTTLLICLSPVGMKWSPDLKMKVKVMKKDTLFSEEVYSPNDEECGYLLERTFEVFNRGNP